MKRKTITYAYAGVYTASICIVVGEDRKSVNVEFTGGRRDASMRKAEFTTTDPEIQAAIERRKDFGVTITVAASTDIDIDSTDEDEKGVDIDQSDEGEKPAKKVYPKDLKPIVDVSSVASAKMFLMPLLDEEKKKELSLAKKITEVKDFAATCGYVFPDW